MSLSALNSVVRRAAAVASRRIVMLSTTAGAFHEKPTRVTDFAVEGPDGLPDFMMEKQDMEAVNKIIDFAAHYEDSRKILAQRAEAAQTFAVDAPDGEHDLEDLEEHAEGVKNIIDAAAVLEDAEQINAEHAAGDAAAMGLFAVDAPDGEHDLEDLEEHAEGVKKIIDFAARAEDPKTVEVHHETDQQVRVEAEKHPEHDW